MKLEATIVLPANDLVQVEEQAKHLAHYFTGYQHLPIFGASSFADAWQTALGQANFELLILTHQDVRIQSVPHDLELRLTRDVGLLGVAGTTELTAREPWWYTPQRLRDRKLSGAAGHAVGGQSVISSYGPYGQVLALDGVCLVTTRHILGSVDLDFGEAYRWDFYDHVLSMKIRERYCLETAPIFLFHGSTGQNRRATFGQSALQFSREYLGDGLISCL